MGLATPCADECASSVSSISSDSNPGTPPAPNAAAAASTGRQAGAGGARPARLRPSLPRMSRTGGLSAACPDGVPIARDALPYPPGWRRPDFIYLDQILPDPETAPIGKCAGCRFTAPLTAERLCGRCAWAGRHEPFPPASRLCASSAPSVSAASSSCSAWRASTSLRALQLPTPNSCTDEPAPPPDPTARSTAGLERPAGARPSARRSNSATGRTPAARQPSWGSYRPPRPESATARQEGVSAEVAESHGVHGDEDLNDDIPF